MVEMKENECRIIKLGRDALSELIYEYFIDSCNRSIKMINTLLESSYYRLIQGNYLYLTKIFLQQYVSLGEENEKELRELFVNDNTRESFLKKFAQIPKDYR